MDTLDKFVGGCLIIFVIGVIIIFWLFPKTTKPYYDGIRDTHKEAFEKGFMTKEIDKEDKVIYRWLEPHKYNEQ